MSPEPLLNVLYRLDIMYHFHRPFSALFSVLMQCLPCIYRFRFKRLAFHAGSTQPRMKNVKENVDTNTHTRHATQAFNLSNSTSGPDPEKGSGKWVINQKQKHVFSDVPPVFPPQGVPQ